MVATQRYPADDRSRFVIRPNSSLSWKGNVRVFLVISVVIVTVALMFSSKGLWLIWPFAGLEIGVLGLVLYLCARRAVEKEVIDIDADRVIVERGRYRPQARFEFIRAWARIRLEAGGRGRRQRLLIGAHGRMIEIGACLVEDERNDLARSLGRALNSAMRI